MPGWRWVSELVLHISRTVQSQVVFVETKKHESCPSNCIASTSEVGARPPGKYYLGGLDFAVSGKKQLFSLFREKKQLFSVICSRREKAMRPLGKYKATNHFKTKRHRATIMPKRDDPFYGGRLRKDMI